jgi:hypothetical protein
MTHLDATSGTPEMRRKSLPCGNARSFTRWPRPCADTQQAVAKPSAWAFLAGYLAITRTNVHRISANPVNDEDTQARTGFPIRVGSGADRDRRQAGPNETVSGASMRRPLVTFRDEAGRLRVAADGREPAASPIESSLADSDSSSARWVRPGSPAGCGPGGGRRRGGPARGLPCRRSHPSWRRRG